MDLTIGLTLGLGLAVALFATHRRERHVVEHYRNVDQKFYERWQAYCQLQRLMEQDAQEQERRNCCTLRQRGRESPCRERLTDSSL